MNNKFIWSIGVIAVFALILASFGLVGNNQSGIVGGTDNANRLPHGYWDTASGYYVGGTVVIDSSRNIVGQLLTQGGSIKSTTTIATAATLTASDILSYAGINAALGSATLTLTLPASSTLSTFAPNIGDTRDFFLFNSTTTAGNILTLAGGTGSIVKRTATSSPAEITSDTDGGAMMLIRVTRVPGVSGNIGDLIWNVGPNAD